MKETKSFIAALSRKTGVESGVTTIEYAVMLTVVSVAVSAFGLGLGGSVDSVFSRMVLNLAVEDAEERDGNPDNAERELHDAD